MQDAPAIEETLEKKYGQLVQVRRDGGKIRVDSHMTLVREADGRRLVIEANPPANGEG